MGSFSCALILFFALCCASAQARTGVAASWLDPINPESLPSKYTIREGEHNTLVHGAFMRPSSSADEVARTQVQTGGNSERPELRWVPSGPDPMHHHSSPEKPKTP